MKTIINQNEKGFVTVSVPCPHIAGNRIHRQYFADSDGQVRCLPICAQVYARGGALLKATRETLLTVMRVEHRKWARSAQYRKWARR